MSLLYNFYFSLPDDNTLGLFGKAVNRVVAKILKRLFDKNPNLILGQKKEYGLNRTEKRSRKLICSLTSFPARADEIWKSIETIFNQSYKADEVVLWLADSQFKDRKIPESLANLVERGLTIRWCDEDLRSHKKYFYVLQEYKDADVVLLDDDLYYPYRLLENLVNMAKNNPATICATRVHKIKHIGKVIAPYKVWTHNYNGKECDSKDLFFTSGAGTLIPTGIMPEGLYNKNVFKKICFFADDVWLNFWARKQGIKIITNDFYNKEEISIGKTQNNKLVSQNVLSGGNDMQIKAVLKYLNEQEL